MIKARAIVNDKESKKQNDVIADIAITVNKLNYERCIERLYPMILDKLCSSPSIGGKYPHIMSKLSALRGMTADAVVKFLSSFPDDIKEELIKAAFDDIFNDSILEIINGKIDTLNAGVEIGSVTLATGSGA